jgi:thiol:disulfide interchange protein DsbD
MTVRPGVTWEPYTPSGFSQALASGRPTVALFSASWCPHCRDLKSGALTDARVMEAMLPLNRISFDMSSSTPESEANSARFGVNGYPTILFFDAKGQEIRALRVVGSRSSEDLLETLDRLKQMTRSR